MSKNNDPTIQKKVAQLDELLAWFSSDSFALEQATVKLQDAKRLAAEIENDLTTLENEITIVKQSFASDAE